MSEEKKCNVCGRYYKKNSCEYCKRALMWNREEAMQIFTPRIKKVLSGNEVKVDPGDIDYLHQGGSLLIKGQLGTGKTVYAAAVMLESMRLSFIEHLELGCYYFVKMPDLLQKIRDSFSGSEDKISTDYLYEDFIIIDDLGVEKVTDWVFDILYRIIDHRYEHRLPTIFTTNLNGEQMAERLGGRIPNRLEEMCKVVNMKGVNYRSKNTKK